MSTYENVVVSVEAGIATITLNRPDKLNAFAGTMREEIARAVREMAEDESVRVLVITGAGRAFCAGADIDYMKDLMEKQDTEGFGGLVDAGRQAVLAVRQTPKPVIASVNGPAAGGGANLVLACDIRIASEEASIGQTFSKLGLHPDWGGTYFLPRLVGPSRALELMFTGAMIDATEGHRIGVFNRVVPADALAPETEKLAAKLAAQPPLALALIKQAVYENGQKDLRGMLEVEFEHQLRCFGSNDAKEGLNAFLERRPPTFSGT